MRKISKTLLLTSTLVISPTLISFTNIASFQKINLLENDEKLIQFNQVKEDVLLKREFLKEHDFINFNNQSFYSENLLDEYLFDEGLIEKILTSSNPFKTFKNSDFVLDETKIFDIDVQKFQQVYRTSWGDIAYSLEEALNTYINPGKITPEYSYNDVDWYRSESDAERAAKKSTIISQSLYYLFNSQYYNAFNKEDVEALVSLMKHGLYLEKTHTLAGKKLKEPEIIYGAPEIVRENLRSILQKEWYETAFLNKIVTKKFKNEIVIKPFDKHELKIRYLSSSSGSKYNLPEEEVYKANKKATIAFDTTFGSKSQLLSWFSNENLWTRDWEWTNDVGWWKYFVTRKFKIIKNGKTYNAEILLVPTKSGPKGNGSHKPTVKGNYHTESDQSVNFNFYYDSKKNNLLSSFTLYEKASYTEIDPVTLKKIFDQWFDWYFNKYIVNFGSNENKRFTFNDLKNKNFISSSNIAVDKIGKVYKDVSYEVNFNKGYTESLIRTYHNDWVPIQQKILSNPVYKDGQTFYEFRADDKIVEIKNVPLLTKEQIINYLPLFGNVPLKMFYTYSQIKDPKDRWGVSLAKTEQEARAKELINSSKTLFTRFVFYDRYGNEQVSRNSITDAIASLKKQLQLSSKYVHSDEIDSWAFKDSHAWEDIIADGIYEVYVIKNLFNSDKKLYYMSKETALSALKANSIDNKGNYLKERKELYAYEYETLSETAKVVTFTMDEIDQIVNQILIDFKFNN